MLLSFWSVKGGSGCSTVTTLAAAAAMRSGRDVVVVDLCGELDGFVGGVGGRRGLADIGGGSTGEIDEIVSSGGNGLSVLRRGRGSFGAEAAGDLLRWVDSLGDRRGAEPVVLVDAGVLAFGDDSESWSTRSSIVASSDHSALVMRPCFLAHRRAIALADGDGWWVAPDSVVLVDEPGRALNRDDIENLLGVPVLAEVPVDPGTAQAIDAGALLSSPPPKVVAAMAVGLGWGGGWSRSQRGGLDGPEMEI